MILISKHGNGSRPVRQVYFHAKKYISIYIQFLYSFSLINNLTPKTYFYVFISQSQTLLMFNTKTMHKMRPSLEFV